MPETAILGLPEIAPLRPEEFRRFKEFAYERFGLDLRDGKEDLIPARLGKKVRELGFRSFSAYLDFIIKNPDGPDAADTVDLLTTNFTSFFRERPHFDLLERILEKREWGREGLRIWSAASSSGEEPYSIAMMLLEHLGAGEFELIASDVSKRILEKAKAGVYTTEKVAGIPDDLLRKYFLRGQGRSQGLFRTKPVLRDSVQFRHLNLVQPFSHDGVFSMIWIRNVMIYFDKATQEVLINKLTSYLVPGGYLLTGHSEALNSIRHSLDYVQPAVYRKRGK